MKGGEPAAACPDGVGTLSPGSLPHNQWIHFAPGPRQWMGEPGPVIPHYTPLGFTPEGSGA